MTLVTTNLTDPSGAALLGGGWDFIETQVVSGSPATIDVINLSSDYFVYKFIWWGLQPTTDQVHFWIRTSSTNGSTWDGGGTNYAWVNHAVSMETSPDHDVQGDNSDSRIEVVGDDSETHFLGNDANEDTDWEFTLFNPSGTEYTKLKWEGLFVHQFSSVRFHSIGAGVRLEAAAVNGVRFLMSTGNIASGTLWVYGIKAT